MAPTLEHAVATCRGCLLLNGRCYSHQSGQRAGAENVYINAAEDSAHYTLEAALGRRREHWPKVARLCAIGDAARVPRAAILSAVARLREEGYAVLGYTHFWRDAENADLKPHLLASCDDLVTADAALALGWRPAVILPAGFVSKTFTTPGGAKGLVCPEETGRARNCASCKLCDVSHPMWARGKVSMIGFVEHGPHVSAALPPPSGSGTPVPRPARDASPDVLRRSPRRTGGCSREVDQPSRAVR